MLVRATRTASILTLRALFYGALFLFVVVLQLAVTSALRGFGVGPSVSLFISGGAILALVLVLVNVSDWAAGRIEANRELERLKQDLPAGSCCVIWRGGEPAARNESAMPWEVASPLHARYPKLARQLGVEGIAIVEFEIGADGRAKNVECIDVWPSPVFYEAAREALLDASFQPKHDEHVRFGVSYRIPFVFRITGAADVRDAGHRARQLRPFLQGARQIVDKFRRVRLVGR
jgi:TonB family protein